MRFEVMVAGSVHSVYNNRVDAENMVNALRNSFLAMVHPSESFYIREVETNK
jgi:hypothetical protein